jgi:hypothetical protein
MPEDSVLPPLQHGTNPSVSGGAGTASNPRASTIRSGAPAGQRRKRYFLLLELFTIIVAVVVIGVYGNLLGTLGAMSFNMKHFSMAGRCFRAALFVQERLHGSRSLALNEPLNDLAYFYYNADQMNEAVLTAERSLSICQENRGAKDPRCAWVRPRAQRIGQF